MPWVNCPDCGGLGQIEGLGISCPACKGQRGWQYEERQERTIDKIEVTQRNGVCHDCGGERYLWPKGFSETPVKCKHSKGHGRWPLMVRVIYSDGTVTERAYEPADDQHIEGVSR